MDPKKYTSPEIGAGFETNASACTGVIIILSQKYLGLV